MTGERILLFRRAKVVKKVSQDTVATTSPPTVAPQSSLSRKRPTAEARPPPPQPLFSKRQKSIAHKRPRSEILDLTKYPPSYIPPAQEVPRESSSLHPSTSDSLHDKGVDSAPRAKMGYLVNFLELPYTVPDGFQIDEESGLWKKQNAFRASRPLFLKRIRRDYDVIKSISTLAVKEKK
ncbi:hypothetical protein LIER_15578 [Lithospermum erythrorhizon]|uniref:Uncharacterized protein n=1 Tax=Lithospermum erythrorhizon TaxID=34254 RepID=A0AAV3Q4Z5_LITER